MRVVGRISQKLTEYVNICAIMVYNLKIEQMEPLTP